MGMPLFPVLLALTFSAVFSPSQSVPGAPVGFDTTFPYDGVAARTEQSNHEAECYMDARVGENPFIIQENGGLDLVGRPVKPGKPSNPCGTAYDSGLITTFDAFNQTYGYFEAEIKMPAGQGLGSSGFWLLPVGGYSSELDVMENLGSGVTTIYSSAHGCSAQPASSCVYADPSWATNFNPVAVKDVTTHFHTYGVDWEHDTTTFYVDRRPTVSIPTPMSMNAPMYLLLNLAIGGNGGWAGPPDAATHFPAVMKIHALHAWRTAGTIQVGGSGAIH